MKQINKYNPIIEDFFVYFSDYVEFSPKISSFYINYIILIKYIFKDSTDLTGVVINLFIESNRIRVDLIRSSLFHKFEDKCIISIPNHISLFQVIKFIYSNIPEEWRIHEDDSPNRIEDEYHITNRIITRCVYFKRHDFVDRYIKKTVFMDLNPICYNTRCPLDSDLKNTVIFSDDNYYCHSISIRLSKNIMID